MTLKSDPYNIDSDWEYLRQTDTYKQVMKKRLKMTLGEKIKELEVDLEELSSDGEFNQILREWMGLALKSYKSLLNSKDD